MTLDELASAIEALGHPDPIDRLDAQWNAALRAAARIVREQA